MKATLILSTLTALMLFGCSRNSDVEPTVAVKLSQPEMNDLLFLYEEEKMARDLYLYGSDEYGANQFNNISVSEQRHMDAVVSLFELYDIETDLVTERGDFSLKPIQLLYADLHLKMQISETDAFTAAALVEETDIMDIRGIRARTNNEDIHTLLESLECGSENHLRAYTSKLKTLGVTYVPIEMPQDDYDLILNEGHANCGM